jgi:hypothetical protein
MAKGLWVFTASMFLISSQAAFNAARETDLLLRLQNRKLDRGVYHFDDVTVRKT